MGFRFKLILSYAAVIFLTLLLSLLIFGFLAQQIQQAQRRDAEERLSRQTQVVQNAINNLCPRGCFLDEYRGRLQAYAALLDTRILLIDERGIVQVDTASSKETQENRVLSDYKLVARDNNPHLGTFSLNGIAYIYYALPGPFLEQTVGEIESQGGLVNLKQQLHIQSNTDLVLSIPEARLGANWNDLVSGMLLAGLLVLGLSVVAAILIARGVAQPLIRMTRASEAIAQGDYSQQLPEPKDSHKDEMGRLAVTFNRMAREVARSQQTMRDFVANVSHELKTPLTSIQGFSQAILDGTADDRTLLEHSATVISHEAARMRRLVDELLDLSRIESGQVELARREIDLEKLLARVITKLDPQATEKYITLHVHLHAYRQQQPTGYTNSSLLVLGDGDRLEQIFTNILDNAIKYSPPRGEVGIRLLLGNAESSKTGSGIPTGRFAGAFGRAVIEISNRGSVIPPEQLPRIFERFYKLDKSRAKRRGESTGLGLAIAKELIEAHRGTITVTSYPLPATTLAEGIITFTISLPLLTANLNQPTLPNPTLPVGDH
jgi:signal transduction histidine kinase